jgi:hypothetical protein
MSTNDSGSPFAPRPLSPKVTRRRFLKRSLSTTLAAPLVLSLEDRALLAQTSGAGALPPGGAPRADLAAGRIGSVTISRLICGGNLISGYAHSRDLTYVSSLLRHYFTEEKIMETWALSEQHGINTMVASSTDPRAGRLYEKYAARGGRIQYIAQVNPRPEDLGTSIRRAADAGAVGAFLVGNLGDRWVREGAVERIGEVVDLIKAHGLIGGVAGHELRTIAAVERAGVDCDFYVKTLHQDSYWSRRRPDQKREVVDNRDDNYWCTDAAETIAFMARVRRPWIAFKVLAAGAIKPQDGFRYAFESGADFALVGMFDFQIGTDVMIVRDVLAGNLNRRRAWLA